MHELGLSSRKPFKKCARVVGEVSLLVNGAPTWEEIDL